VAYARFLLSHLNEPDICLVAMVQGAHGEELSSSRTLILRAAFVIQLVRPMSGTRSCIKSLYSGEVAIQYRTQTASHVGRAGIKRSSLMIQPAHIHGEGK